jgi:hypothetical protein
MTLYPAILIDAGCVPRQPDRLTSAFSPGIIRYTSHRSQPGVNYASPVICPEATS